MTWEDEQTRLVEACRVAGNEFSLKTPAERYQFLVDRGLICAECAAAVPWYSGHAVGCSKEQAVSENERLSDGRLVELAALRPTLSINREPVEEINSMASELRRHRAAALSAADREALVQMRAWMSGAIDDRNPSVVSALAVLDRLLATHDATSGGEES